MNDKSVEQIISETEALKKQISTIAQKQYLTESDTKISAAYQDSFELSVIVVIFGSFICLCLTFLILKKHRAESILRPFGTILIIIGALFLIVAGYSEQQISPVIGLLGTIAGYILGKDSRSKLEIETAPVK